MESIKTAVILAGGKGTGFLSTQNHSKTYDYCKRPTTLVHIMNIYISQNITNFAILAGYKSEIIWSFLPKIAKK